MTGERDEEQNTSQYASEDSENVREILENVSATGDEKQDEKDKDTLPDENARARAIYESLNEDSDEDEVIMKKDNDEKQDEEGKGENTLETGVLSRATFHRRGFFREMDLLPHRKELLRSSRSLYGDEDDDDDNNDDVEQPTTSKFIAKPAAIERFQSIDLERVVTPPNPSHEFLQNSEDEEQPSQLQLYPDFKEDELQRRARFLIVSGLIVLAITLITAIVYFLTKYI